MKKIISLSSLVLFTALFIFSCADDADPIKKTVLSIPSVTTGSVSNISTTGAMVAGNVTSNGNATVTERGICYGLTMSPTIDDNKMASGTGTGAFSVTLSALTENTKYYIRAYATNSEGVAYGTSESFMTDKPGVKKYSIGDLFEGGVIYHLNDDSTHGLAVADTSLGKRSGGCHGTAITGAVGFKIGDGVQNTKDIVKECSDVDCAANFVNGLSHGGYSGWHLPSRDELLTLHTNWSSITKIKIPKGVYWASNQNTSNKANMAHTAAIGTTGALVYEQKNSFASINVVAVKEF